MNDKVPCSSTKLMRGGTAYSSSPFELKLQLHGQVSNPYNFNIKQNYESSATTQVEFTYQEWTTPGSYTWTAPFTGTAIIVVIGGGGGSGYCHTGAQSSSSGGTGGISQFKYGSTIAVQATGGTGGKGKGNANETDPNTNSSVAGSGGSPNGRAGNVTSSINSSKKGTCSGGQGFALSTTISNGSYGKGADVTVKSFGASGGSGGRNQISYQIISGTIYTITVGSGGSAGRDGRGSAGNSGAVAIWKG